MKLSEEIQLAESNQNWVNRAKILEDIASSLIKWDNDWPKDQLFTLEQNLQAEAQLTSIVLRARKYEDDSL